MISINLFKVVANVGNPPLCSGVIAVPSGPKSQPQPRWRLIIVKNREKVYWCRILTINDYWHSIWGLKSQSWRFYLLFLIATISQEWCTALLTLMSFAAQRTPLVPHEEARLDGSYLSKMSQVDFLIMNNMLEVKALSVASKASWVREFEILFHLTDFAFNWWTTNIKIK